MLSASGTLDNVNSVSLSGSSSGKLLVFVGSSGLQVSTVITKGSNGLLRLSSVQVQLSRGGTTGGLVQGLLILREKTSCQKQLQEKILYN